MSEWTDDDEMSPEMRRIQDAVEDAQPLDDMPIVPLGRIPDGDNDTYAFLDRAGYVVPMSYRALGTRSGIDHLFGGVWTDWLADAHPRTDDKGRTVDGDWDHDKVRGDLFIRSNAAGSIDLPSAVRGPGAWRHSDGTLILHCGDRVFIDGDWRPSGFRKGKYVYPRGRTFPHPARRAASAADAAELFDLLGSWRWLTPGADRLALGWIACAFLSGALEWRPHVWVTGLKGFGKSTLERLIFGLLGDALYRAAAPTEASVRQGLAGAARPVALDEIEFDGRTAHAREVLELARLGSTDLQAPKTRGSLKGGVINYYIRGCFYFTSILHAPMKQQDQSRVTVLRLDRLDPDAKPRDVARRVREAAAAGPAFFARMVEGWDRLAENLVVYEQALGTLGASFRQADQFGTLLAAAETLLCDTVPTLEEARQVVALFADQADFEDGAGDDGPQSCLNRLASFPVTDIWRSGERKSHGEMIVEALANPMLETARKLRSLGVVLMPLKGPPKFVGIARKHDNIRRIFEGTEWADGAWSQMLGWLEDAPRGKDATPIVNFGDGVRCRVDQIPVRYFAPDGGAAPPAQPAVPPDDGPPPHEGDAMAGLERVD